MNDIVSLFSFFVLEISPPADKMRGPKVARIVGVGMTPLGKHNKKPSMLMRYIAFHHLFVHICVFFYIFDSIPRHSNALELALGDAGMTLRQLDGLVAIPSLADPHFVRNPLQRVLCTLVFTAVVPATLSDGSALPGHADGPLAQQGTRRHRANH
jgi:hypothetical protein